MPTASKTQRKSEANLGFEAKLWQTADKLRNKTNAAEYKHVVRDEYAGSNTEGRTTHLCMAKQSVTTPPNL